MHWPQGTTKASKHPRIRGENSGFDAEDIDFRETSPHTRGELKQSKFKRLVRGNIPAYAGRTVLALASERPWRKHPRIRGENALRKSACCLTSETSPHTRGEQNARGAFRADVGNIPAYAGRTGRTPQNFARPEKHPRIRGENTHTGQKLLKLPETSPHTRGEPFYDPKSGVKRGNIPAYAGRTK